VDLERESQRPGPGQDLTRLFKSEGFGLAEHIHKRQRQPRSMCLPPFFQNRQHGIGYFVGIALRVILKFGSNGVCAKEGDHEVKRAFIIQCKQGF
jgi:hypothetical protein